jgi:LPS-assembly protein
MFKITFIIVFIINTAIANTCKNTTIFETKFSTNGDEIEANANKTSFINKNTYKLQGNAEVYTNDYYISANDIEIKKSEKTVIARDNVKVRTGDIYTTGDSVTLIKEDGETNIKTNNVKYSYKVNGANGSAEEFITKGNKQTLKNSSYSFCQGEDKNWKIDAKSITLDKDNNIGVAKDVKLKLFGIPIFWTPMYEWVLKGRESGFLFPSFSSYKQNNKTGYQVDIPYYFNIAPEKDLTLTLKNLSTRGQVINGLYRHLLSKNKDDGYFETELEFLGDDDITKEDRWLFSGKYQQKISNNLNLNAEFKRVSDKMYLTDISHTNSNDSIDSNIRLSYDKDDLKAYIFSENEQTIKDGLNKYTRDIELFVNKDFYHNGIEFALSGIHTGFGHKDSINSTGDRTHINIDIKKEFNGLAYSFKPTLRLNTTNYNLKNQDNKKRSSYSAGFDYKMFLERETNLFGKDILQTLTPRLSYLYTPNKNQDFLPNFDSLQNQTTYEGLFMGENWSGIDRVNPSNNITIGLESDFIDYDNGDTYANIGIARSYNIKTNEKSNIVLNANLNFNNWDFKNNWQYKKGLVAKNNSLSYRKDGINFFSIGHHLTTDNKKSVSLQGALPISGKSHIFAGLNRSITEKTNNHQTIGFVYDSCCTAFRLAHFKEYDNDNSYDEVIKFEIIFKGLGTTNKKLRDKISKQIPNYLPEI